MKKFLLTAIMSLTTLISFAQSDCDSAITLTANGTISAPAITGTYVISCDQSNPDGAGPYSGVWYKYIATANGTVVLNSSLPANVAPNSDDTRVSVWQGSCTALTCIGGSDDISATNYLSTFSFNVAAGTTYFIQWDSRWSALAFNFDFTFTAVACLPVTAINLPTNIQTTSITLNWTAVSPAPTGYQVEYGAPGFVQGTGTTVSSATNSVTISTGLAASTVYDFYVRTNCGTSQSTWTTVSSFTTAKVCPQSFGFENNVQLAGWSTFGNGSYGLSANAPTLAQAGNFYWIFNTNATAVSNNWLYTPPFSLAANESVTITFWVRCATARSMRLTVGNASTIAAQTTQLWANSALNNPTYTQFTANYIAPAAGIYYFGFNDISTAQAVATLRLDSINFNSVLSTNDFLSSNFSVFPNPVKNVINFSNDANAVVSLVEMTDMNGRVIKSAKVNATEGEISVSDLSSGIYMMKITSDQGTVTKKIVKQ